MCTAKGRPIIICDKDDVEMENKAFHCLKVLYMHRSHRVYKNVLKILQIPKVADCLQGILTVVPLQLLSFHIAVLKGFDVSEIITHLVDAFNTGVHCIKVFIGNSPRWYQRRVFWTLKCMTEGPGIYCIVQNSGGGKFGEFGKSRVIC